MGCVVRQRRVFPEEVKARARQYRELGYSVSRIAKMLDTDPTSVRCWTDPEYVERRRAQIRALRPRYKKAARFYNRNETGRLTPEEEAALPPLPPDTRSTTGVLLGDPLPGRSALDRRHE